MRRKRISRISEESMSDATLGIVIGSGMTLTDVVLQVEPWTVIAGYPAKVIKKRVVMG